MSKAIVPFGNQRQIQAAAEKYLSSFNGDQSSEFSGDEYLGYDDDFLEFDGEANSFANEVRTGRRFTITLDNMQAGDAPAIAASTNKNVILVPSFNPSGGFVIVDGGNNVPGANGEAGQNVVVSGIPESLVSLQKWIEKNPVRCLGLKIESTNVLQMGKYLTIAPKSPFRKLESENIYIQDYKDERQYQDKVATIMRPFFMDNQTDIILQLAKASITTVTFYFGAALNTAKALRKKAAAANATLLPMGHRL